MHSPVVLQSEQESKGTTEMEGTALKKILNHLMVHNVQAHFPAT